MDPKQKFALADGVLIEQIEGEAIVLNPNDDTYFSVNDVGAVLLSGIDDKLDLAAMTIRLTEQFDVDAATAAADLEAFIGSLLDAAIITTL